MFYIKLIPEQFLLANICVGVKSLIAIFPQFFIKPITDNGILGYIRHPKFRLQ